MKACKFGLFWVDQQQHQVYVKRNARRSRQGPAWETPKGELVRADLGSQTSGLRIWNCLNLPREGSTVRDTGEGRELEITKVWDPRGGEGEQFTRVSKSQQEELV